MIDFKHKTLFAARSIHRLAAASDFDSVLMRSSQAVVHGLASAAGEWSGAPVSACHRVALAAHTGMLRDQGLILNLTFIRKGVEFVNPAERDPA
jgi:hypothetical protein